MSLANRIIILTGLFLITLVFSNPGELRYLKQISSEYGAMHHGMKISPGRLLEMGKGERHNFIFASSYRYRLGNVAVEYMGFAGIIFKTEISTGEKEIQEEKKVRVIA